MGRRVGAEAAWGWSLLGSGVFSRMGQHPQENEMTDFSAPTMIKITYCGDRMKADLKKKKIAVTIS